MSGEGLSQRGAEFQLQPVPASKRKRSTANNDRPRVWQIPTQAAKPTPQVTRPVRIRRAQSVPNMKAQYSLDLSVTAQHSINVPARLVHSWNPSKAWAIARPVQQNPTARSSQSPNSSAFASSSSSHWSTSSSTNRFAAQPTSATASAASGAYSSAVYTPSVLPPINSQTLKELDLHEILKNPQLRHDLVFDADLQFRPNFDGERGRRKRDLCNKYWRAIQREIQSHCCCTSFYGNLELPCVCASNNRRRGSGTMSSRNMPNASQVASSSTSAPLDSHLFSRLPNLIAELRCICLSVLPSTASGRLFTPKVMTTGLPASSAPPRTSSSFAVRQTNANKAVDDTQKAASGSAASPEVKTPVSASTSSTSAEASPAAMAMSEEHALIMQCLDPSLIMQQLHYGVLDIAALLTTVGSILKQHCAPMRDCLIDGMIETITQYGDITRSLRQCFEILELMKLDVANHQLSTSRVYLVETAPEFEARWLRDQVCKGKVTLSKTEKWFNQCLSRHYEDNEDGPSRSAKLMKSFDEGFLDLVFDPPSNTAPQTAFRSLPSPSKASSASLFAPQSSASTSYPETFQFDTFRLLTFHGEITDITVVSMLLLLFRQLACSTQNLASNPLPFADRPAPSPAIVSQLASAQLDSVKCEIWTLLREAEIELSSPNRSATHPSPPTPGGVAGRVLDSRLSSWRKVVGDIVLQIGARAIQVQVAARHQQYNAAGEDASVAAESVKGAPLSLAPSQDTIALLTRWLETNLHSASQLFKLCRTRVRSVLARQMSASGSNATLAGSSGAQPTSTSPSTPEVFSPMRAGRKRAGSSLGPAVSSANKRPRHNVNSSRSPSNDSSSPSSTPAGALEPFLAEISLLADRMRKVKAFHLTVNRVYYERISVDYVARQQKAAAS